MIIIFTTIASIYALLILAFCYYWRDTETIHFSGSSSETPLVSVIVAFRNEEKNISRLIESLLAQTYDNCEFIFINDHSDDKSLLVFNNYTDKRIKLVDAPEEISGKKAALRLGYENSAGEILYFTDADCILGKDCVRKMVMKMIGEDCSMLCGPVRYMKGKTFASYIGELDFLTLTGSGAAGFFMGKPFMCNGANYAVKRNVYAEADLNTKYTSGDDVFLLHYANKHYQVQFIQDKDCIVETNGIRSFCEFFSQRVRWASKATGYKNIFAIIVSLVVFAMSLSLIVSFSIALAIPLYFLVFFCIFMIKLIVDTYFTIRVLRFYDRRRLMLAILPFSIIQPLYIVTVAMASLVYKPKWKGRRI